MDDSTRKKLARLLGLLGSDHDGEVLSAARAIKRLLISKGLSFGDLVSTVETKAVAHYQESPNADLVQMAEAILENAVMLRAHEERFVRDVLARAQMNVLYNLTIKQANWFAFLFSKYGA